MKFDEYYECFSLTAITAQHPSYNYNFMEISN